MSAYPKLPRRLACIMFARLCAMLPPPADDTDQARTERDLVAIAAIAGLGPVLTMEEAALANIIVAADFHAQDALGGAGRHADQMRTVLQCRAQAMGMWRQRHRAAERLAMLQAQHPQPDEPAIEAPIGADPAAAAPDRQPTASPPPAPPRTHGIDPYGRVPVRRIAGDPLAGSLFADLFDDLPPSVDTGRSARISGTGRESHETVI